MLLAGECKISYRACNAGRFHAVYCAPLGLSDVMGEIGRRDHTDSDGR